jgi:hypothetical protein
MFFGTRAKKLNVVFFGGQPHFELNITNSEFCQVSKPSDLVGGFHDGFFEI